MNEFSFFKEFELLLNLDNLILSLERDRCLIGDGGCLTINVSCGDDDGEVDDYYDGETCLVLVF